MANVFTMKVPNDISKVDFVKLVIEKTGDKDFSISDEDFETLSEPDKEKTEILEIINPFYTHLLGVNNKESRGKIDELIDIGRFIYHSKKERQISIVECNERPDFIIEVDGERIGVEHTRLIDDEVIVDISNLNKILQMTQQLVLEKYPSAKGLFNIDLNVEKIDINKKGLRELTKTERNEISNIIAEYIVSILTEGSLSKPDFIDAIDNVNHEKFELTLSEKYIKKELTQEKLIEIINKKEAKI